VETPLLKRVKREINATQDEIKELLKSKGWNMVTEATIKGNNVKN
jgi:arginine repressor